MEYICRYSVLAAGEYRGDQSLILCALRSQAHYLSRAYRLGESHLAGHDC